MGKSGERDERKQKESERERKREPSLMALKPNINLILGPGGSLHLDVPRLNLTLILSTDVLNFLILHLTLTTSLLTRVKRNQTIQRIHRRVFMPIAPDSSFRIGNAAELGLSVRNRKPTVRELRITKNNH